ncbi:MAG: AI-2E family transporter [Myxococcota bacterium]
MDDNQLLKVNTSLLALLALLAVGATLYFAQSVIVPFALAAFAAFAAEPIVRLLQRVKVPRWLGALFVVGLLFLAIESMVEIIVHTADQFQGRLPIYLASLQALVDRLPLPEGTMAYVRVDDPEFWQAVLPIQALVGSVGSWAGAATSFVANTLLVLLLMVALIIGRRRFDERLDLAAGHATGRMKASARVIDAIDAGIQHYMLLKTGLSLAVGLCFWLLLTALGADFAILWGVFACVMNFIPTVGPILATIPAVVMLFLQFGDSLGYALIASASVAVIPTVFGNIIEPKVFGDSLNLNFFAILFALVLWAFLWGASGAVLSVPIMMAISLICREVPALRPVHELLRA